MEIVKTFGLNPILLLAQIVNFLILLYLLKRFLYKPVLNLLKEREERIQKGIDDAIKAAKLLEDTKAEQQKILKEATSQASLIIQETRKETALIKESFEQQLIVEKNQILMEGRTSLAQERLLMENQLMSKVAQVAVEMVEKTLSVVLNGQLRKKISQDAQKQILKQVPS